MNTSGEAADQVVRMSMEVGEAALKISGEGAKQLAVLLYAILKEQKKTRGRARLETLVRSGKPLTVFSVKESDLKKFVQEAKRYGILYCAVRDPKGSSDGMVDIMVKEEDAPRINRIVERFKFASVTEAAQIKTEIQKSREEKSQAKEGKAAPGKEKTKEPPKEKVSKEKTPPEKLPPGEPQSQAEPEKDRPGKSQEDLLVDELLGNPVQKEEGHKTIHFDTLTKTADYEVIAVFKTTVYDDTGFKYYLFANAEMEEEFQAYVDECKSLSLYDTGVTAEYGDKLITLSTCEYSKPNGRLVVVAKKAAE